MVETGVQIAMTRTIETAMQPSKDNRRILSAKMFSFDNVMLTKVVVINVVDTSS